MITQIYGPVQGNQALFVVRYKLRKNGIRVLYPFIDSFILFNGRHFTFNPQRWSKYEIDLYAFNAIKKTDFHIVCNETNSVPGLIDFDSALSILNALFYGKPIIMTKQPLFSTSVDLFTKELIMSRLDQMQILDIPALASETVGKTLELLPKRVNYNLSTHERTLIRSHIKRHFRDLLQPMKKFRVYHAVKTYAKQTSN